MPVCVRERLESTEDPEDPPLDLTWENGGAGDVDGKNSCSYKKSLLKRYSKSRNKVPMKIFSKLHFIIKPGCLSKIVIFV